VDDGRPWMGDEQFRWAIRTGSSAPWPATWSWGVMVVCTVVLAPSSRPDTALLGVVVVGGVAFFVLLLAWLRERTRGNQWRDACEQARRELADHPASAEGWKED
jgi:hypothetical protein